MNAPLHHPVMAKAPRETSRFPNLTAAELAARNASDRAFWLGAVADMDLKPGITGPVHASVNPDRLSFDAWR
jgi:hypothetical protein